MQVGPVSPVMCLHISPWVLRPPLGNSHLILSLHFLFPGFPVRCGSSYRVSAQSVLGIGLESEKDSNRVKPWSLPSRQIVLFLVLGDTDLPPCGHLLGMMGLRRKHIKWRRHCLMGKEAVG